MKKADMIEERIERRERKKTMTLNEYIAENGDKQIEIQEDGTVWILEEEGTWKPETGESYYVISDIGNVGDLDWQNDEIDKRKLEIGNVFQTEAEANRALRRLKAQKKFLDAGGHEGVERYFDLQPPTKPVWHIYPTGCGYLRTEKKSSVTAFDIWFESEDDARKAINSLNDEEVKALCWMGDE